MNEMTIDKNLSSNTNCKIVLKDDRIIYGQLLSVNENYVYIHSDNGNRIKKDNIKELYMYYDCEVTLKDGRVIYGNFVGDFGDHKLHLDDSFNRKGWAIKDEMIEKVDYKKVIKHTFDTEKLNESVDDKILYIIRGVPGSGKSTLAKTLTKNVVEADQFLYDENGEYVWTPERVAEAHRKCQGTVRKYMEEGRPKIAVANTFIKLRDMKPYIKMAEENGYKIVVKSRPTNKYIDYLDNETHESIHNMSDEKMEDMKNRFQQNDEPVSFIGYHGGINPNMTPYEDKPFYMCSTYKLAKAFAKREVYDDGLYDEDEIPTIFKFKGTFKHPYYMTEDEYDAGGQDSNIVPEWFIDNGYDGIIMEADGRDTYYIAIDLSTIKCIGKKSLKVNWDFDAPHKFGHPYEIEDDGEDDVLIESVIFDDLAYNGWNYEQLTVILNPSIEWLRNQLNSDKCWGFRFLHNTEKNKLYVWDCRQPWMHQQVFDIVDMDWGKSGTNVIGIFEPNSVAVWEELADDGEAESSIALAKKLDEKFFKELYPNGYQITTCC